MEAFFIGAQEGSRYDRFSPLVKGVFRPSIRAFGLTWDTDLVGSKEGGARAREGGELRQGKGRAWGKAGAGAGSTHDLARTLLPLDLRGRHFISQGALAHH